MDDVSKPNPKTHVDFECPTEVAEALLTKQPVVALESTILSHGMPYPQNLEMAHAVETIVREQGAVPATIAILGGKVKIGLTPEELEYFASQKGIQKVSRRDFAYVLTKRIPGATTVAATMIAAARAGIRVFATGGIGGVHRGGELSLDISADLWELAQTPVAVICAGVKSILDIGRTLEVLETYGVPVVGFRTHDFPAFYTRQSGYPVDFCMDSAHDIAGFLKTQWSLSLNGVVIANPVPPEFAMPEQIVEEAIEKALHLAETQGIRGKEITPFLLDAIQKQTQGASLKTNIALVRHNAQVAAQIAVAYCQDLEAEKIRG